MSGNEIRKFMNILNEGLATPSKKLNETAPSHGELESAIDRHLSHTKSKTGVSELKVPKVKEGEEVKIAWYVLSRATEDDKHAHDKLAKDLDKAKDKVWDHWGDWHKDDDYDDGDQYPYTLYVVWGEKKKEDVKEGEEPLASLKGVHPDGKPASNNAKTPVGPKGIKSSSTPLASTKSPFNWHKK